MRGIMQYPSVDTAEHRADMKTMGVDWTWLDYLSAGDAVQVVLLLMKLEEGGPDDAIIAAASMLERLKKTAETRMETEAAG